MDVQSLWSALLVPLGVVVALLARRQVRCRASRRRDLFGLGLRDGAAGELGRGAVFSVPFVAALLVLFPLAGLATTSAPADLGAAVLPSAGIALYFLVLFALEEVIFRGLLMSGLGVLTSRATSLGLTSVLVAGAYAFAPGTGVLPVLGAVVANALHGWARWRSGRIWWGLGQRWVWNSAVVVCGFADSGFALRQPLLRQELHGPGWLTGGGFGVEGGLVGVTFLAIMIAGSTWFARGRRGPWTTSPSTATTPR